MKRNENLSLQDFQEKVRQLQSTKVNSIPESTVKNVAIEASLKKTLRKEDVVKESKSRDKVDIPTEASATVFPIEVNDDFDIFPDLAPVKVATEIKEVKKAPIDSLFSVPSSILITAEEAHSDKKKAKEPKRMLDDYGVYGYDDVNEFGVFPTEWKETMAESSVNKPKRDAKKSKLNKEYQQLDKKMTVKYGKEWKGK